MHNSHFPLGHSFVLLSFCKTCMGDDTAESYLDPALDANRPVIASDSKLKYDQRFGIQFNLNQTDKPTKSEIKVTKYAPLFTTHGYSMNQRLMVVTKTELKGEGACVFIVSVPSAGIWVQIKL
ncbi:hypothetical protein M0R45_028593 [Rubus argutus]|uniref:Galactose oxidase-like Early set domain-containing protein n=1 Tax=Rubus argutus TaxID=59490 RepID=A0AAW1W9N0_RUBAR